VLTPASTTATPCTRLHATADALPGNAYNIPMRNPTEPRPHTVSVACGPDEPDGGAGIEVAGDDMQPSSTGWVAARGNSTRTMVAATTQTLRGAPAAGTRIQVLPRRLTSLNEDSEDTSNLAAVPPAYLSDSVDSRRAVPLGNAATMPLTSMATIPTERMASIGVPARTGPGGLTPVDFSRAKAVLRGAYTPRASSDAGAAAVMTGAGAEAGPTLAGDVTGATETADMLEIRAHLLEALRWVSWMLHRAAEE